MTPAEQEQRVLCEVLQGHGYAVEMLGPWCCSGGFVVWGHAGDEVWMVGTDQLHGPECDTPEDAIAWVLANVPRATASPAAP